MGKKKYATDFRDNIQRFECTQEKCGWVGKGEEKYHKRVNSIETELVCPECGNNEFYGLLLIP